MQWPGSWGTTLDTDEWMLIKIYLNGQYGERGSKRWGTVDEAGSIF